MSITEKLISTYDFDKLILPSKQVLTELIEDIRALLFPNHFGQEKLTADNAKEIVDKRLENLKAKLKKQLCLAYGCSGHTQENINSSICENAERVCEEFLEFLPDLKQTLDLDIIATLNGDPAAESIDQIIFSYPGIYAVTVYRIAHFLHERKVPVISRILTEYAHSITGIDIHPGATIGKHFFIDHGTGIVIGETTVIGDNVKIYQGVTLGALSIKDREATFGKKRHPTIKNNVTIYSGASILGGDTIIGENSVIGGNAFITHSIPDCSTAYTELPKLSIKCKR